MISTIKRWARALLQPPMHKPDLRLPYVFLGTEYGGWPLLNSTPRGSLVYSFGIGEDISFDLGAIDRFGCVVHGFDPTPKSQAWVQAQMLPKDFIFHPIGLSNQDGDATFFAPENQNHVSFSVGPSPDNHTLISVQAPVRRLSTLVHDLQTSLPDIVKMDVEGFEYDVLENLANEALFPRQLLIEFHHGLYGIPNSRTESAINILRDCGYRLFFVSISGREYGLVRQ